MRGIVFILAPVMALARFAVAEAGEPAAPVPIKLAVFPFELEDFSAAAAYIPPTTSTASNCGFRPKRRVG